MKYNQLKREGGKVKALILNREEDGRGLSRKVLKRVIEANSAVLITCDLGINDHDLIDFATKNGVDVMNKEMEDEIKKSPSEYSWEYKKFRKLSGDIRDIYKN